MPNGVATAKADDAFRSPRLPDVARQQGSRLWARLREGFREQLVKQRWLMVVPVVLPLSKAYDTYWRLKEVYLRELGASAQNHAKRVAGVSAQIRRWNERGRPGLLHTSRKGWQSVSVRALEYKRKSNSAIDVELHDILALDREKQTITVEPRVNMAQITRKLAPLGLSLPVVPELDDLTAGGLFLGYGIESSSHLYGLFADTVKSAELVLADGRVVRASDSEHRDLFRALPWSYGALGMLTALELPVIPALPYVRLTYKGVHSLDEAVAEFTRLAIAEKPPRFLDALMFSRDHGVLMYGDFAELPPGETPNRIGRFYKPWFYTHAERLAKFPIESHEYIPLRDYYHRYTRSLYWHGELLVPFGNHPLFRYLLGWLMPPKVSLMRLVQTEAIRKYRDARNVVQDVLIPIRSLRDCLEMMQREFEAYPVWLCAHKTFRHEPRGMMSVSSPQLESEMFVDVGVWQVPGFVKRGEAWDGHAAVRRMEAWTRKHHGYQCLYAVTEQTESEFWRMFDRTLYARVRAAYGADGAFLDTFDKVRRVDVDAISSSAGKRL
jgi:delta24-sterol reductase